SAGAEPLDIDRLLSAAPSAEVAWQLVQWADSTRNRIVRGDMMIGILTPNEVAKIPVAYRSAAEYGDSSAWVKLAWWYALPQFGEPDVKSAEAALQQAINANVENAKLELVKIRWFFKRQTATPVERQEAYEMVSGIADLDPRNAEAVYFLALLSTHGFGVEPSPQRGFALQERAAELGNADAMFELYVHYIHGLGVPSDENAALQACRQAAEAGHSRAMYNLGAFNASGRSMPKNIPEAIKWYERASDSGNPSAMAGLAA